MIEVKRIYHFKDGSLTIENVSSVDVDTIESVHRLVTSDGKMWTVPNGWYGLEVIADGVGEEIPF